MSVNEDSKSQLVEIGRILTEYFGLKVEISESETQGFEVASFEKVRGNILIVLNHINLSHGLRLCCYALLLEMAVRSLDDFKTSLYLGDGSRGDFKGLSMSDAGGVALLVPDAHFLMSFGYEKKRIEIDKFITASPFRYGARKQAYWRGSLTGRIDPPEINDRLNICAIASECNLLDALITSIPSYYLEDKRLIKYLYQKDIKIGHYSNFIESLAYGVQIDIDGHSNSWDGFFLKLYSGIPVVKVRSRDGFKQWYYPRLIEGLDYLEVSPDGREFMEALRSVLDGSDGYRTGGFQGRQLARALDFDEEVAQAQTSVVRFIG